MTSNRPARPRTVINEAPPVVPVGGGAEHAASGHDGFFFEGVESPNGTIFPDVLIDRVMPHLSGAEFKVLAYVVRRTFGFKKESDSISLDQICNGITRRDGSVLDEGTGLARKTAVAAIQGLEGKGVILCRRRSSPEKGNLPTTFALRFRGQPTNTPETNRHQGGNEMYPRGGEKPPRAGHLPSTAPGTAVHPQPTVVQPTVKQGEDGPTGKVARTAQTSTRDVAGDEPALATEPSAEAVWQEVLARLAVTIGAVSHRTWLAPTRLQEIGADTAIVAVPHALAQRWVERHLRDAIATEIGAVIGRPLLVQFVAASADGVADRPAVATAPAALPAPFADAPVAGPADRAPATPLFNRRGGVIRRVRSGGTG